MPKVSVIVPIYKVEKYLSKCIQSVLEQTMADFQLILVDDGSPDQCPAICDEFAIKDSRIKVIHKENGGLSSARNAAYAYIDAEFVLFLDSDDYLENNALEVFCDIQAKSNADVVVGNYWYFYEDHEDIAEQRWGESCMTGYDGLKELVSGHIQNFAWGKLIRKDLVKRHLFPDGMLFEDFFWTHHIFAEAEYVAVTKIPLVHYRQRSDSISYNFDLKRLDMLDGWTARDQYLKENYPELEGAFLSGIVNAYIQLTWMIFSKMKGDKKKAISILRTFSKNISLTEHSTGMNKFLVFVFNRSVLLYAFVMFFAKTIDHLKVVIRRSR